MALTKKQIASLQAKLQKINALPKEKQAVAIQKLSPGEVQFLQEQQCIFCRIVKHEVPAHIVYEDEEFMAFLDVRPANPGHVLVIPKQHYFVIPQMPDDVASRYFILIKNLAGIVHQIMGATRVQLFTVGVDVPHAHMHIVPRFENDNQDTLTSPYKPIKLQEKQFKEIAKRISSIAKKISSKTPVYDMSGRELTEKEIKKKGKKRKTKKVMKIKPRLP